MIRKLSLARQGQASPALARRCQAKFGLAMAKAMAKPGLAQFG